jgi:hypothetical protein
MLLLVVCLLFISKAHDDLVAAVVTTFGECTGIIRAVGDFIDVVDTVDFRRRAERRGLAKEVDEKLDSCGVILKAVNDFRTKYIARDIGLISLLPAEMAHVKELLRPVSKKLGEVLYIASRDGQAAADFHRECNNQGPTVVIVETTTGALFGGYTDGDWSSSNKYVPSSAAFLFRLRPSYRRYPLKAGQDAYATYSHQSYGPTFGRSGYHDLYIINNALSSAGSYTYGGKSYEIPPKYVSYELSNGYQKFQVKDYVVAKASDL